MVLDPVKGRRAEHKVGPAGERHRRQRDLRKRHPVAKCGAQVGARRHQHVPRPVDGDQAALRQALQQLSCETSAAAPGVDRPLVAAHGEAGQDLLPPTGLRSRHLVISLRIPFGHNSCQLPVNS